MLGTTVLLFTDDRAAARTLAGHLRGAGNEVVIVDRAAAARDLIAARAVELVLVDDRGDGALDLLEAARGVVPAVVLSAGGEPAALVELVCRRGVEHVLVRSDDSEGALVELARQVVVAAEKLLRGDRFGIDKYLPAFGVERSTAEVRCALDRDAIVERIADHVEWLGAGREARRAVAAVVDELVTNAVYDAPRDAAGHARYHATDRRTKVELLPSEYVTVAWGSDGDAIVIGVTDRFGALRLEHVRDGLQRCLAAADPIEQKAGGAGIGLYTALAYSAQLVVNVEPGVRTEIVAVIDLRRRSAGVRRTGRSLQLGFGPPAAAVAAEAAPVSIEVSESLRVDLRALLAPSKRRVDPGPPIRAARPPSEPAPRARGSSPPPLEEPIGADTACGLLRGATTPDGAVQIGLRFLAHHYETAVGYAIAAGQVDARHTAGRVHDWAQLRALRIGRDDSASVAALAGRDVATRFRPIRRMDCRIATLATGDGAAGGLVMPLRVGGEPRWVLYGARPRRDAPVNPVTVERVRGELARQLARLDPDQPEIEISIDGDQTDREPDTVPEVATCGRAGSAWR